MAEQVVIDMRELYTAISGETAKVSELYNYIARAKELAGEGNEVVLTGAAPIWMYLKIAHALHGKARRLLYTAPGQGIKDLEIFSHDPY